MAFYHLHGHSLTCQATVLLFETWDFALTVQQMAVSLRRHHSQPSVYPDTRLNCTHDRSTLTVFDTEHKLCQDSILHHSPCSTHHSLRTMHKSPITANHAPFTCYHQPLAFCCAGNGYLCSIRPSVYAQHYEESLPDSMTGADFLTKYHHHYDHATQVVIAPLTLSSCTHDCHRGLWLVVSHVRRGQSFWTSMGMGNGVFQKQ